MSQNNEKLVADMTVDELYVHGLRMRNWLNDLPEEVQAKMLESWTKDLVTYQGLSVEKSEELRSRLVEKQ